MGNMKKFSGPLTNNWHRDQIELQKRIIDRYVELGIMYVLPAFAGFVPNEFLERLYPLNNFTRANSWNGFNCNYSW